MVSKVIIAMWSEVIVVSKYWSKFPLLDNVLQQWPRFPLLQQCPNNGLGYHSWKISSNNDIESHCTIVAIMCSNNDPESCGLPSS
jgi:hypothetical protein